MTRIAVTEEYLKSHAIPTAQRMRDPHRTLTDVSVRTAAPAAAPTPISAPPFQPEELAFNQGPNIDPDAYHPSVEQKGGTLLTLSVLLPKEFKPYVINAGKEVQLTGVA